MFFVYLKTGFADEGLIAAMKASDTWRIIEKEELEMRELKATNEKLQAKKQKALEIGIKMKKSGMDTATIKKLTGLRWQI